MFDPRRTFDRLRSARLARAVTVISLSLAGLVALPGATPALAATDAGALTLTKGSGAGAGSALASGGSATGFGLKLPAGAACSGDTATNGYRVQTFMVSSNVTVSTMVFDSTGPSPQSTGATVRLPLFSLGTPYIDGNTAVGTGAITGLPVFDFAVFGSSGPTIVPNGTYTLGVACTKGSAGPTQVDKYWTTQITVTANPSDTPSGFTWVAGVPAPPSYALTVTKAGSGTGSVTSSPSGVDCGATCSYSFTSGTAVTLTATPSVGSVFGGWFGACSGTGSCAVTVDAAKSVTAVFAPSGTSFNVFAPPQRLVDTRAGQTGVLETVDDATAFSAGEVRRWVPGPVLGVPNGGALMLTVVAVAPSGGGFLSAYPCDSTSTTAPLVSTLNYQSGLTIANNGLVRLDPATGGVCVKSSAASHVVIDAYGWFAGTSTYASLSQPARLFDTRAGQRGALESVVDEATPYTGTTVRRYVVAGVAGIPASGAVALGVNVAAVSPTGNGEVRLYPCTSTASSASTSPSVVFTTGATISGGGTVTLSSTGGFCVRATAGTHVIVDTTGYYTSAKYATFALPGLPKLLVDTRSVTKGGLETTDWTTALAANTTYRWALASKAGFPVAAQIGSVRITITELTAAANGFVAVWACANTSTPPPATAFVNFRAGIPIANSAIVPVSSGDAGICIRTSQPTHIALNTTNWFTP